MNKKLSDHKGIYPPSSDVDKNLAQIRVDLALGRYKILVEKGKRWTIYPKKTNENPQKKDNT